ncbi:MAG: DUF4416 family protein [Deltaproteobacteria bacterium]|nr:DUF4416 family protein [Deltaproteobacteria bacterium]
MSIPCETEDVKLISSLFSPEEELVDQVIRELEEIFGPTDRIGPRLFFDRTRYYAREMGWPLHRRFISFRDLIRPDGIVDIKMSTNKLEGRYIRDGKRRINIDPGYISLERLVLATGKNFTHRICLSRGIFADLTLIFHRGSFRPLEWTFKDYAHPKAISYFNDERERYFRQLRGLGENQG